MEFLVRALQLLLSLSILVLLHEFGHFIMARMFKVRVEKFYLFFDWKFSLFKFKRGDTEYGIGWIPLGGYVKIAGMIDESMDLEQMKQPAKPYEFRAKPAWQRLLIMIGGVLVNFILAFVIYIMVLFTWGEQYLPADKLTYGVVADSLFQQVGIENGDVIVALDGKKVDRFSDIIPTILFEEVKVLQVKRNHQLIDITLPPSLVRDLLNHSSKGFKHNPLLTPRIPYEGEVMAYSENSPAQNAGMLVGDRILALNGKGFTFYDEFTTLIKARKNDTLEASVLRGSDTLLINIPVGAEGVIGVYPKITYAFDYAVKEYGFFEAIPAGVQMGVEEINSYLKQFKLFKNPEAFRSVGGFLSIGSIFPSVWDWHSFWNLTALLSIILGVMNLLPIPALDGGHVLFLLYEVITRRQPSDKFMEKAQMVGMAFILLLLVWANLNDIMKLFM